MRDIASAIVVLAGAVALAGAIGTGRHTDAAASIGIALIGIGLVRLLFFGTPRE